MNRHHHLFDNALDCCMPLVSSLTPLATKGMPTQSIHSSSTMQTRVGPTYCSTQTQLIVCTAMHSIELMTHTLRVAIVYIVHWLTKIQWELLAKAVHSGWEFGGIGSFSTLIFYSHHTKLLPRGHRSFEKRLCYKE